VAGMGGGGGFTASSGGVDTGGCSNALLPSGERL